MFPKKTFIKKVAITSSAIKTATSIDLTSVASGEFLIRDIILKTDSTGLAGGTNLQIKTTNSAGLVNVLVEAVSNLGANKTVNMDTASVTKQKTVLESGSKIQLNCTAADCTGAGIIYVYIVLAGVDYNSKIN